MPPEHPETHPSQQVERIREIILGRDLERLEKRIAQIESRCTTTAPGSGDLPARLDATEAHIEALYEQFARQAENTRREAVASAQSRNEEINRLATMIQQVAAERKSAAAVTDAATLERSVGTWLSQWQQSLAAHLDGREQALIRQLRDELTRMSTWISNQVTERAQAMADRHEMETRFARIAAAARALADAASSPSANSPSSPR